MSTNNDSKKDQPKVHNELKGFAYEINAFGELSSTLSIDQINHFLNNHVEDKKLPQPTDTKNKKIKKK